MVFIVRMDTMPLQGFAQVRDPSKLDALGGPRIGAFCGFSTPENVLQRSTWRYEILHLYGAGVSSDLRSERSREYRTRSGASRCTTRPGSVNAGTPSGSGQGRFSTRQ